ncbi:MAG TPA: [FeFe] hydrogenase H-cluster radical SAM maturase HydE [Spirochaetota bacterium]|nr:[FeFe] hydrogenase H-cluster radical SAM maturase HydE [Spirochaetota bacterium]
MANVTSISKKEIIELLSLKGSEQIELHRKASEIRRDSVSDRVYIRGLIEFSNICENDCFYCGIRKSNNNVRRYELTPDEILGAVDEAASSGLTSVVLQSGERRDRRFISLVTDSLRIIKQKYPFMGITLSSGEQDRSVYEEFHKAGASRYLLRIETSNEEHYNRLHPGAMSFRERIRSLHDLRDTGFQVGTGVMINSPFQIPENLADDILFFQTLDIDMCGMGPFIPHSGTPLGKVEYSAEESFNLGLNMIAVLRIVMPDINIASTTALETLSPAGRESGLMAGANVVMPQFSPFSLRDSYTLYDNKPLGSEDNRGFLDSLKEKIKSLGLIPVTEDSGTSIHYIRRTQNVSTC